MYLYKLQNIFVQIDKCNEWPDWPDWPPMIADDRWWLLLTATDELKLCPTDWLTKWLLEKLAHLKISVSSIVVLDVVCLWQNSIAVSLFGWSEEIQNKSSPNRVSDSKIKMTTLILRPCPVLTNVCDISAFKYVRPLVKSWPTWPDSLPTAGAAKTGEDNIYYSTVNYICQSTYTTRIIVYIAMKCQILVRMIHYMMSVR